MTLSARFKKAHALAKAVLQAGDNYRVTFGLCLSFIISQEKSIANMTTPKSPSPSLTSFSCTCCGKAINKPRFIKGQPFGPSCYNKKLGKDAVKSGARFVKAERLKLDTSEYIPHAVYKINGVDAEFKIYATMPLHFYAQQGLSVEDDLPVDAIRIINHDGKTLAHKKLSLCKEGLAYGHYTDAVIIPL